MKQTNVTTASISLEANECDKMMVCSFAASGCVILIHLENMKRGEGHIPSLWFVNGTFPCVSSSNFGTWESPASSTDGRTDGRTDDRYQDVRLLASHRHSIGAWFVERRCINC